MTTFKERKIWRTEYYNKFIKGWKLRPCGACGGTGKESYKPEIKEII